MKLLVTIAAATALMAGSAMAQTINNAPVGSVEQKADQERNAPRTGDSSKTVPQAPTGQQQSGPATINNAPVGSIQQKADQERNAPRTGDSSKTIPR